MSTQILPLLRRAVQAIKFTVGGTTMAPNEDNVVDLPFERVQLPASADPAAFQRLFDQVASQAVQGSSQVQASIAQLRDMTTASASNSYYVASPAPGRVFAHDPTDFVTPDDGVFTIVSKAGLRFHAQLGESVYISWFGVEPGDVANANDASLGFLSCAQLLAQKGLANRKIAFPAGRYRWSTQVVTNTDQSNNLSGTWYCPNGAATMVTGGTGGIWLSSQWNIEGIYFDAYGASPVLNTQGQPNPNVRAQEYKDKCPVQVSAVCHFKNFQVNNAAGHGIRFNGNMAFRSAMFPTGSNSSCSHMEAYQFQGNGGAAIYIEGTDENSVDCNEIYFNNATDAGVSNNGWGYVDRSFLGCRTLNRQANSNRFGHNRVEDPNAIASLLGIYEEDTNQDYPSYFNGATNVEGRLTGYPVFDGLSVWRKGRYQSHVTTSNLVLQGGGTALSMQGGGAPLLSSFQGGDRTHVVQQVAGAAGYMMEMFSDGATLHKPGTNTYRAAFRSGYAFDLLYYGPYYNVELFAPSLGDPSLAQVYFQVGDRVRMLPYATWQPEYWLCTRAGTFSVGSGPYPGVVAYVNPNTRGDFSTDVPPTMFNAGDQVVIGGHFATITQVDVPSRLVHTSGYFDPGNASVYHAPPTFQARGGHLSGPKAYMPGNLSALDAGLTYYAVDEQKNYTWNGAAFGA